MKTSKKALALALAAAMVVTGIPATNAEAASKAKLSATKATIYVGGSKTVSVKAPSTWKSVAISTVSSNKKSVATVKKASSKSFKVTAVKAGTAKVTVKVSYKTSTKKNAKKYTKTLAFTANVKSTTLTAKPGKSTLYIGETTKVTAKAVPSSAKITYATGNKKIATVDSKGNIKAVKAGKVTIAAYAKYGTKKVRKAFTITVKEPVITLSADKDTVAIGDTVKVTAETTPSSAKVTYSSSDESIATVDADGTVKAVKAGKATITATSDYGPTKAVEINVKEYVLQSVKQNSLTDLEVVIAGKASEIKTSDVKIVNDTLKQDVDVKEVNADKNDATKFTVSTYVDLKESNDISVTIGGVTKTFKATDGKVVTLDVDGTKTIPYGIATPVEGVAKDANGVVLQKLTANTGNYTFDIEATAAGSYTDGNKLYLDKKGDVATVKLSYFEKYDENGAKAGEIKNEVKITAVDPEAVTAGSYTLKIGKDSGSAKENASLGLGDTAYMAFLSIKDSKNNDITIDASSKYTMESGNDNVLIVDDQKDGTANLTAVQKGTTAIVVKFDGKTVKTFNVTVGDERKVNSFKLSTNSVKMYAVDNNNYVTKISYTAKDQYGQDFAISSGDVTVTDNKNNNADVPSVGDATMAGLFFDQNGMSYKPAASAETKEYTVALGGFKQTLKLETVAAGVAETASADKRYAFYLSDTTVDTTVSKDDTNVKDLNLVVLEKNKKGEVVSVASTVNDVVLKKGNDVATYVDGSTLALSITSGFGSVTIAKPATGESLAPGTYTLTSPSLKLSQNIVVTNKNTKVSAKVLTKKATKNATITGALTTSGNNAVLELKANDGDAITVVGAKDAKGDAYADSAFSAAGSKFVKSIIVKVVLKDGQDGTKGVYTQEVPIGQTITFE